MPHYHDSVYKARRRTLWYRYGLTLEDYWNMLFKQDGKCYICKRDQEEIGQNLRVDHNHITDKIRKLLCGSCNNRLGWFEKRSKLILDYIEVL